MPHPTLPTTGPLATDQIRGRLEMLQTFLREPCTATDRANARLLITDTMRRLPETDVVGRPVLTPPVFSLDRAREADGADLHQEVG